MHLIAKITPIKSLNFIIYQRKNRYCYLQFIRS